MHHRRFILPLTISGLIMAVLLLQFDVFASDDITNGPDVGDGTEEIGEWLLIIKNPSPPYVVHGEDVQFSILVLNTSKNVPLKEVVVNDPLSPNCNKVIGDLAPDSSDSIFCSYEDVQVPFTNEAVVTGKNANNNKEDRASDTARVEVLELSTTIETETKMLPSPGPVKFTVTVKNLSSVNVELDSLTSPELGNLADPQNGKLENNTCTGAIDRQLPANVGSYDCSFTATVSGQAGDYAYNVTATASVKNAPSFTVSGSGATVVKIIETIATSLSTNKQKVATGKLINLATSITNTSESSSVDILTMEDAVLGDITLPPHGNCTLPQTIEPLDTYTCYYQQTVTAAAGEDQSFILNVTAKTNDTPPLSLKDQASVTVTAVEPLSFLPITPVIPRPTSCNAALKLKTNNSYQFHPDTIDAFYKFDLAKISDIEVKINNTSSGGQAQLFKFNGEACNPGLFILIDDDLTNNKDRILEGKAQPPGTYFVWVIVSEKDLSTTDLYSLIIRTE